MGKSQEVIAADPGKMKHFLIKVNTDVDFRKRFLENPVVVLNQNGFTLSPEAKREVEATVKCMNEDISDIAKRPKGYEKFLRGIRYSGKMGPDSDKLVGMWID